MFGVMMIDTGPKFYTVPSPPHTSLYGQGHGLKTFMSKFCVKVFRTSLFPNPMMDLVHVWCDDRYWSKILHSAIPTSIRHCKVMVTDLELLCQSFVLKFLGPHYFQTL